MIHECCMIRVEVRNYTHNSFHYFPVILLYYAPISMCYSQNYSQDHYQNCDNPGALKMILYCEA